MNILSSTPNEENLAGLFRLLSQPSRLQILRVIGAGEACVCHIEAALGLRQAHISQQLMLLRDAGLVTANRDGRNIYYRLADPSLLDLVARASALLGSAEDFTTPLPPPNNCPCPHCAVERGADPQEAVTIDCDGAC